MKKLTLPNEDDDARNHLNCYGKLEQHVNYGQMSTTVQCNSGGGGGVQWFPVELAVAQQQQQ